MTDESRNEARQGDTLPEAAPGETRERGFTLMMALLVMVLLTTLGLTLMFTSETERSISRNYAGQIQASYAAEAVVEPMVKALLLDLRYDTEGWRNRYLVVCELTTDAACFSKYAFHPESAAGCNTTNDCLRKENGSYGTGRNGQYLLDLEYRPGTITPPTFPNQLPVRLHRDMAAALPWWQKYLDTDDTTSGLTTGTADIALTSVCSSGCTGASPVYARDQVYVTGIGSGARKLFAHITKINNQPVRSVTLHVKGKNLYIWGNALVGGSRGDTGETVIDGDYLIRGSTLQFNDNPARVVLDFSAPNTGIVNNWYDSDSVAAISGWWWRDAKGCGTAKCDPNNTALAGAFDSDNNTATFTVEPISHHLPNPPDQNAADGWPGGYVAGSSEFPGPEGLDSVVRVRLGKIKIDDVDAGLGRTETFEGLTGEPGHYYDNIIDLFSGDTVSATDIIGTNPTNIARTTSSAWNQTTKTGAFDIDATQIKFPSLSDAPPAGAENVYQEPVTAESYTPYYDFLRPASPSATHPGGWALDLTDIDGTAGGNSARGVLDLDGDPATPSLTERDCWPSMTAAGIISPTLTQLRDAFGTAATPLVRIETCGGNPTIPPFYVLDETSDPTLDAALYPNCAKSALLQDNCAVAKGCTVILSRTTGSATADCPDKVYYRIFRREVVTRPVDSTLNLDTSGNLDSPPGRARATMFDSFAFKLYRDVTQAIDGCNATLSKLYQKNLSTLPAAFTGTIPTGYPGLNATDCTGDPLNPCFRERSAYLDVHIQLPDLPVKYQNKYGTAGGASCATGCPIGKTCYRDDDYSATGPSSATKACVITETLPADGTTLDHREERALPYYSPSARWLSVRFRPSGATQTMEVLSDPRARPDTCNDDPATDVSWKPATDLWFEVFEDSTYAADNNYGFGSSGKRLLSKLAGFRPATTLRNLGVPAGYDRAVPLSDKDMVFRNMPTGAFVVSLHLPCTTSLDGTNNNPYKCSTGNTGDTSYVPPATSYPGFYTHLLAWAPKYSCWRTTNTTFLSPSGIGPQRDPADATWGAGWSATCVNNTSCPSGKASNYDDSPVSWFAEDLLMANLTTLWNTPAVYPNGDGDNPSPPTAQSGATLSGFKLLVPSNPGTGPDQVNYPRDRRLAGSCRLGLDRRTVLTAATGGGQECSTSSKVVETCTVDQDGMPCNGKQCESSGCSSYKAGDWDGDGDVDAADCDPSRRTGCSSTGNAECQNEPDFVFGGANPGYGGCTEIFTPIVKLRQPIDPGTGGYYARKTTDLPPLAGGCLETACYNNGGTVTQDHRNNCIYPGVDPDTFATYARVSGQKVNRYSRAWPGWGSYSVLEAAGLIMTNNTIEFGAPLSSTGAAVYNHNYAFDDGSGDATIDCPDGSGNYDRRCGFYSDPIIYDGRAIIYAGTATTAGSDKVTFYDHVLPRTRMGCSDFLSVLSNGNTTVRMEMPFDLNQPKRHMLALFNLTEGTLDVNDSDTAIATELAGAWIAGQAKFRSYTTPVQLIGTPTISSQQCDHVFLPGRDPLPQREYLNYVEDEVAPPSY